jgi:hypothetical protein
MGLYINYYGQWLDGTIYADNTGYIDTSSNATYCDASALWPCQL